MKRRMARVAALTAAMFASVSLFAGAASAHYIEVDPAGDGDGTTGWVGGPVGVPGQGEGLVMGGPDGDEPMPPSHVKGLNAACEALRANGNGVVDIYGPPSHDVLPPGFTSGCAHGDVIPPPE